jgi:hypothetical protein
VPTTVFSRILFIIKHQFLFALKIISVTKKSPLKYVDKKILNIHTIFSSIIFTLLGVEFLRIAAVKIKSVIKS